MNGTVSIYGLVAATMQNNFSCQRSPLSPYSLGNHIRESFVTLDQLQVFKLMRYTAQVHCFGRIYACLGQGYGTPNYSEVEIRRHGLIVVLTGCSLCDPGISGMLPSCAHIPLTAAMNAICKVFQVQHQQANHALVRFVYQLF